jgi:hypothetical protein
MSEHRPERGDQVEVYIKRKRDEYPHDDAGWIILDDLLDDYRLHADTGTPLAVDVPSSRDEIEYTAADRSYDQWAFAQDYGS